MSDQTGSASSKAGYGPNLPTVPKSTDLRLWVKLLSCAKMGERVLRRRFEDDFKTTLPRFDVLAALYAAPDGLRMSELAKRLLVSNGNVTVLVRQLQERGDVAAQVNPTDRRSAIVTLTSAGRSRFLELSEAHRSWVVELLDGVSQDEKDALEGSLGKLQDTMSSNLR